MGKENASIGQGKALKAGWITKDKDYLKAKVWLETTINSCMSDSLSPGRIDHRYEPRTATNNTEDSYSPRPESSERSQEAEIGQNAESDQLHVPQRSQICT